MAAPMPDCSHSAHRDWVIRLREEYDSLRLSASEGLPSGAAPPAEDLDAPASGLPRALQPGYERRSSCDEQASAQHQLYNAMFALEMEDAPVYRSIGGHATPQSAGYASPHAGGGFEDMSNLRAQAAADGPGSVDELWLRRMPPLVTRQSAFRF